MGKATIKIEGNLPSRLEGIEIADPVTFHDVLTCAVYHRSGVKPKKRYCDQLQAANVWKCLVMYGCIGIFSLPFLLPIFKIML